MTISEILLALDEHAGAVMAIATIVLAGITAFYALRTQEILKVQRRTAELSAMPRFRFEDFYNPKKSGRETWVRIKIEGNIARKIEGKILLRKEDSPSGEIVLGTFRSLTAMPKGEVSINVIRVDDKLNIVAAGDRFRIQAELEYESLLGGKYKSGHWLIFKKIDDKNNTERILSDMEYNKMPF